MSEITVTEAEKRRSTDQILDVREDFEVAQGTIPGAVHIPLRTWVHACPNSTELYR